MFRPFQPTNLIKLHIFVKFCFENGPGGTPVIPAKKRKLLEMVERMCIKYKKMIISV